MERRERERNFTSQGNLAPREHCGQDEGKIDAIGSEIEKKN